jgi:1,4-dihydroxy-2-naphthoate octaprenyltransferase
MMKIKSFLKLVEIRTKVASVIPFFIGMMYVLYRFRMLNWVNMLIMFASMVIFDMNVTTLNNYYDYKKAVKKHGYGYEEHNSIVQYNLKPKTVIAAIAIMTILATSLGIWLVIRTNIIVLLVGAVCFAIGFLYSFGPMPISRTPFGEILSGLTMGFGIIFLTVYINVYDTNVLNVFVKEGSLTITFDILEILGIIIVTAPAIFGISNIMLANNICDIEDDIQNQRHTMPIVIGKRRAEILLQWLVYLAYAAIILGVFVKTLPVYSLLVLITLIAVIKQVNAFIANPTKKDTFSSIVGSFVIINLSLAVSIGLGVLDAYFLNFLVK